MGHYHHHHEHDLKIASMSGVLIWSVVLNMLYVVIEAGVGFYSNSLGLLSDAGHNLGDVFGLLLALFAFKLAKRQPSSRYTYGYKKSTVLISLVNALILVVAVLFIVIESIGKFYNPSSVNAEAVGWTAGVGIIVNGVTALLLMKGQKGDINIKGAFLHMLADTLVSVGVVLSGVLISVTGYDIIDPIVSQLISIVILFSTWRLLNESLKLSIDGVPSSVNVNNVVKALKEHAHVKDVHHVHVWAISTTEVAMTAHIVVDDLTAMCEISRELKSMLGSFGIVHSTLEFEQEGNECGHISCEL